MLEIKTKEAAADRTFRDIISNIWFYWSCSLRGTGVLPRCSMKTDLSHPSKLTGIGEKPQTLHRRLRFLHVMWVADVFCFCSSISHRPCCPVNFFVGPVDGGPTAPQEDAPACVQRLFAYRLRCLRQFHHKHDPQALLPEEAHDQECCMFLNNDRSDSNKDIE